MNLDQNKTTKESRSGMQLLDLGNGETIYLQPATLASKDTPSFFTKDLSGNFIPTIPIQIRFRRVEEHPLSDGVSKYYFYLGEDKKEHIGKIETKRTNSLGTILEMETKFDKDNGIEHATERIKIIPRDHAQSSVYEEFRERNHLSLLAKASKLYHDISHAHGFKNENEI